MQSAFYLSIDCKRRSDRLALHLRCHIYPVLCADIHQLTTVSCSVEKTGHLHFLDEALSRHSLLHWSLPRSDLYLALRCQTRIAAAGDVADQEAASQTEDGQEGQAADHVSGPLLLALSHSELLLNLTAVGGDTGKEAAHSLCAQTARTSSRVQRMGPDTHSATQQSVLGWRADGYRMSFECCERCAYPQPSH